MVQHIFMFPPGPHKVDGETSERLHWLTAYARLLGGVEDGERAGVEEGQVAQLTLLVACRIKESIRYWASRVTTIALF